MFNNGKDDLGKFDPRFEKDHLWGIFRQAKHKESTTKGPCVRKKVYMSSLINRLS